MGRIRLLPSDLANQIAAGEVVERPASVVKELVENALDAGASRISITVEFGGKKLIRVEDDGEGMGPDDARLALERHATSKIERSGDLAAITTLGFRGEALPSIASVSHFLLRTRARGDASGTEIRVNGGAIASVVEVGTKEGTIVEVADLFYNLPARRKFLKSDAAEAGQISRIVSQLAFGYPRIGFTLTSRGRTVVQCPPAASLRDRLYQLYGDRADLIEVRRESAGLTLFGYIAALAEQGPTRGAQNVYVNQRVVKDRTIAHAIIDAYSTASIKERSPEVHLFLEMPHDWVDVNVHPTKAEVRFRDQSLVHEVVRRTLMDTLGQSGTPLFQLKTGVVSVSPFPTAQTIPNVLAGGFYPSRWDRPGFAPGAVPQRGWLPSDLPSVPGGQPDEAASGLPAGFVEPASPGIKPMIPLGQFRDTFIIAVDEDGVSVIDQHVAHERILFERVMERLTEGRLESQGLLEPLLLEFPSGGREALLGHAAALARFGFELEEFGGSSVRITAVPALLAPSEITLAVRALADDLEGLDRGAAVEDALKRIAALTACHAAVKANYPLTQEKMLHILDELRRTAYSTICPHGRPVMLRLTRREIEKNFERI